MKISVIVPVYNAQAWLGRCLDSILRQTHRDLEILAVDDGSTDGSLNILRAYAKKDPRVLVIGRAHAGVSAARNAALDLASGAYIGFADSDDELADDLYETLLRDITETNADAAACGLWFCAADGTRRASSSLNERCILTASEALDWALRGEHFAGQLCSKLFCAALFGTERFDEQLTVYEDLHLFVRLLSKAGLLVFNPQPLYCYRLHEQSAYHAPGAARRLSAHAALDRIMELLRKFDPDLVPIAQALAVHDDLYLLSKLPDIKNNTGDVQAVHRHLRRMLTIRSLHCVPSWDKYLALAAYAGRLPYRVCTRMLGSAQAVKRRLLHKA